MSDFEPYQDWSPEDEQRAENALAELLESHRKLLLLHNEQLQSLYTVVKAMHERQEKIVEAMQALHEFLQQVAGAVRGLKVMEDIRNATQPTNPSA